MTKYDPYTAQIISSPTQDQEEFEREKAAIHAYEDGWDEWDGPIYPWRQPQVKFHDEATFGEWFRLCADNRLVDSC